MAARELLDPDSSLWDWIAYDLRRYRIKHEMSGTQLGKVMDCTRHTVSNLEAGRPGFRLNEKQAKAIDALWDTGGHFLRLLRIAKAGHDTDWFRQFTGYEARASMIQMYGGQLVPALLQAPDYARALLVAGRNADIEGDFEKRMVRQELLSKPNPPDLWVLLSESVLDWPVGGTEVMRAQLARLLEFSELPHVTLRVVPKSAGAYEGLDGPFKVITVEEGELAFVDAPNGGRLVMDAAEVRGLRLRFDRIGAVAQPVDSSRSLIKQVMETMK
jgi:DNA-binding XRE family transcriptional regulator